MQFIYNMCIFCGIVFLILLFLSFILVLFSILHISTPYDRYVDDIEQEKFLNQEQNK